MDLIQALKDNNPHQFKLLIELGHDVNREVDNCSLLHGAAQYNALQCAELLIDMGFDVNDNRNVKEQTPIFVAGNLGHVKMVKFLLGRGADTRLCGVHHGNDVLQVMAWAEIKQLFRELCMRDVVNKSSQKHLILRALQDHETTFLKRTFLDGFDVNVELDCGYRPIHLSSPELTALLIKLGADVNIKKPFTRSFKQARTSPGKGFGENERYFIGSRNALKKRQSIAHTVVYALR